MGYNTYFSGAFKIEPPLTKEEYHRLAQVVPFWNSDKIKQAANTDVFAPSFTPLTPADEKLRTKNDVTFHLLPDQIAANEEPVKAYDDEDGFVVIAQWLTDNGHQLSGECTWSGDESNDTGTIYAAFVDGKNRVEWIRDEITNAGPSWKKTQTPLQQYLDSRDFYEDSQAYRHSRDGAEDTIAAWNTIKANVLKYAKRRTVRECVLIACTPFTACQRTD